MQVVFLEQNESSLFILFFEICLKVDGYLFIIIITTYTIVTTIERRAVFIMSVDNVNKNIFHLCQKWLIFWFFSIHIFET